MNLDHIFTACHKSDVGLIIYLIEVQLSLFGSLSSLHISLDQSRCWRQRFVSAELAYSKHKLGQNYHTFPSRKAS